MSRPPTRTSVCNAESQGPTLAPEWRDRHGRADSAILFGAPQDPSPVDNRGPANGQHGVFHRRHARTPSRTAAGPRARSARAARDRWRLLSVPRLPRRRLTSSTGSTSARTRTSPRCEGLLRQLVPPRRRRPLLWPASVRTAGCSSGDRARGTRADGTDHADRQRSGRRGHGLEGSTWMPQKS